MVTLVESLVHGVTNALNNVLHLDFDNQFDKVIGKTDNDTHKKLYEIAKYSIDDASKHPKHIDQCQYLEHEDTIGIVLNNPLYSLVNLVVDVVGNLLGVRREGTHLDVPHGVTLPDDFFAKCQAMAYNIPEPNTIPDYVYAKKDKGTGNYVIGILDLLLKPVEIIVDAVGNLLNVGGKPVYRAGKISDSLLMKVKASA